MQRDRRKRYSPARHPVLLRRVLLVLCILAVLWLGYSCMMPQLLFSARGTMIFVPDPPLRGSRDVRECPPRCSGHIQWKNYLKFAILENLRSLSGQSPSIC